MSSLSMIGHKPITVCCSGTDLSLLLGIGIKEGLDLGAVAIINNERWESLAHLSLSKVKGGVVLLPELLLSWGS